MIKNNKKGISLIVLVITIIVIIILAAAVILSINNNNPILNAKKARLQSDIRTFQEKYTLEYSNELIRVNGDKDKIDYNIIKENVGELPDYLDVIDEGIVYVGEEDPGIDVPWKTKEEMAIIKILKANFFFRKGYVSGFSQNPLSDLKAVLPEGTRYYRVDGSDVTESGIISTGGTITTSDGKVVATVIYFGDITGEGSINTGDSGQVRGIISNPSNYPNYKKYAADVNGDGVIDQADVDRISQNNAIGKDPEQNRYISNLGID